MKKGDRVHTSDGPGVITGFRIDETWTYRRPTRTVYAIVQLNDRTRTMYPLKEATMETTETVNPMGGMLIQPLTEPEPTPTDPEPEPDTDDEELTEWP